MTAVLDCRLVAYCADVGSLRLGRFAWARAECAGGSTSQSSDIEQLVKMVISDLKARRPVALGFECPLFIPVPGDCVKLGCARPGEGDRPWSAGAGAGALATGLAQAIWVLREVRQCIGLPTAAFLDWSAFQQAGAGLFLWEAFVSAEAKGQNHGDDAEIATREFLAALPYINAANAIHCDTEVYSLVGAAIIRAGWSNDTELLKHPCVVIKAPAKSAAADRASIATLMPKAL